MKKLSPADIVLGALLLLNAAFFVAAGNRWLRIISGFLTAYAVIYVWLRDFKTRAG